MEDGQRKRTRGGPPSQPGRPSLRPIPWLLLLLGLLAGCGDRGIQDDTARVLALSPDALRLGFRTSAPTSCRVTLTAQGEPAVASREVATAAGTRHRAGFAGLEASHAYQYRIACEGLAPFEHGIETPPHADGSLRIAVLGDSGKASRGQERLARVIEENEPDLILHTGDLLYENDERKVFIRPYARLLADTPFFAATGNHDLEFWDAFAGLFEPPGKGPPELPAGRNFAFDYGNVRVVMIDSNHGPKTLRYQVGRWLRDRLSAEPTPRFTLAVMHHPPYTWGRHDPILPLQQEIVPLLEQAGVDAVFSGHDHNYQRTAPLLGGRAAGPGEHGIVYVVTGAGGGELYEMGPDADQAPLLRAHRDDVYSFTRIDVGRDALSLQQISSQGEVLDRFGIPARAGGRHP